MYSRLICVKNRMVPQSPSITPQVTYLQIEEGSFPIRNLDENYFNQGTTFGLTNERHTDDTTSFLCDALTRTHIISKALLPKMHILTLTRRKQIQNVTLQNVNVIGGGRKARNCSRLQTTKEIQLNVVGSQIGKKLAIKDILGKIEQI